MEDTELVRDESWKNKALVAGAVVGALTGMVAAYLLVSRAAEKEAPPKFTPGEGVKLGLLLLGLVKQIAQMFD